MEVAALGSPSPIVRTVSVDVKLKRRYCDVALVFKPCCPRPVCVSVHLAYSFVSESVPTDSNNGLGSVKRVHLYETLKMADIMWWVC